MKCIMIPQHKTAIKMIQYFPKISEYAPNVITINAILHQTRFVDSGSRILAKTPGKRISSGVEIRKNSKESED